MTTATFANPLGQAELGPAGAALGSPAEPADQGGFTARLKHLLPSGVPLADDVLARRHRALYRLLAAHIPVLFLMGELAGRARPLASRCPSSCFSAARS